MDKHRSNASRSSWSWVSNDPLTLEFHIALLAAEDIFSKEIGKKVSVTKKIDFGSADKTARLGYHTCAHIRNTEHGQKTFLIVKLNITH